MPKPNFIKKPIEKLLDEPLSKLPASNRKLREEEEALNTCDICGEHYNDCECDPSDFIAVDRI